MARDEITIKNMVCPRCIAAVKEALGHLGIEFEQVQLGTATLKNELTVKQKKDLAHKLEQQGFEILDSGKASIISKVKSVIIQNIHHAESMPQVNFSVLIAAMLGQEYTSVSRLFSAVEGITIEKYITKQRIEKAKELLFYGQLSLSEIAFRLNYSSSAYLSAQFKKETGMTPTEFKRQQSNSRKPLNEL